MSFARKIFLSIFLVVIFSNFLVSILIYFIFKTDINHEFLNRYHVYGDIVSNALQHIEVTTDLVNKNAALLLAVVVEKRGIPTNRELDTLAKIFGVNSFYIINKNGKFLRSSDTPLKLLDKSLFTFSNDYRGLINGNLKFATTPIIPGYPDYRASKLTMIPNHDKTLILESGTHLQYLSKILHQIIGTDKNIQSIGLYTPNGFELGSISSNGIFSQGKSNANKDSFFGDKLIDNFLIFSFKIPTSIETCPECAWKQVSYGHQYYYVLRIKVSLAPLSNRLSILKKELFLISFFIFFISTIIAKFLSKKLVNRIKKINHTAHNIIESKNLNLKVHIGKNNDEITTLAETFNKMIYSLKISQAQIIESEKNREIAKLSAQVAHDIRSPLATMEITLSGVSANIPESQRLLLNDAIQSVRDIANNLLTRYRDLKKNNSAEIDQDNSNTTRPVLLSSLIETVISQKRQEWQNNPCELFFITCAQAKSSWINVVPSEIKRMLSNLLNNAYEALRDKRKIEIKLTIRNKILELQITDQGDGIPEDKISEVLKGLSLKHAGEGFGLLTANQLMEKLGGKLILSSVLNQGTCVSLHFPVGTKPQWFSETIHFNPNYPVIVLDDDVSMHSLWRHRLQAMNIHSLHFMQSDDVISWYKNNPSIREHAIFLMDYELRNNSHNGFELLQLLNVKSRGYLITSHAEESPIQNECEKLGVWLIPKCLTGEIVFSK